MGILYFMRGDAHGGFRSALAQRDWAVGNARRNPMVFYVVCLSFLLFARVVVVIHFNRLVLDS
jgi:hypothetical protein